MIREVFVCLAIIILILVGNFFSQNYTSKSVAELTEKIDELKQEVSKNEQDETVIKNKKVLILDDVYTTGSTAKECSKLLKSTGVKHIGIITIAKD